MFAADFDCVSEDQLEFQSTKVSNIMWHRQDKKIYQICLWSPVNTQNLVKNHSRKKFFSSVLV